MAQHAVRHGTEDSLAPARPAAHEIHTDVRIQVFFRPEAIVGLFSFDCRPLQPLQLLPVSIGPDVWIGAGVRTHDWFERGTRGSSLAQEVVGP